MDFASFLLGLHNLTRWLIILAGIIALVTMFTGLGGRRFGPGDRRAGLIYTIVLDVQLLIGLVLYGVSPFMKGLMQNMGEAMSDSGARFFLVEHAVLMVLAIVAAHVGTALARNANLPDRTRFMRGAIFYVISLVLVFAAIPWDRSFLPWA
ncbi:MAG TPA: hypothetical protein VK092_08840 [Deinococcales bacterium]|nr:hypothetical protein [Deinococcales bacterium]